MRMTGGGLIGLGIALLAFAMLGMTTHYEGVLNIGLLQMQEFVFHGGLAAILTGSLLLAAGALLQRVPIASEAVPANDVGVIGVATVVSAMLLFLGSAWVSGIGPRSAIANSADVEMNAEARADAIEAQADRLEALADAATGANVTNVTNSEPELDN